MASYEYKASQQSNINWGETFNMSVKAPAVANRIFQTLDKAQEYVDDQMSSAVEGVRITVIGDPIQSNNGLYYIKSLPYVEDGQTVPGVLVKVGSNTDSLYVGNAVWRGGSTFPASGVKDGALYLNNNTLDLFRKDAETQEWVFIANILPQSVDYGKCYYILSRDGSEHPTFSLSAWSTSMPSVSDLPQAEQNGQWFLWTRLYYENETGELSAKYTCSMIFSSLNMGTFSLPDDIY